MYMYLHTKNSVLVLSNSLTFCFLAAVGFRFILEKIHTDMICTGLQNHFKYN